MGRVNQFYESGDDDMSKLNNEKWESVLKKVVKTSFICVTLLSSAIFWSFGKKKKKNTLFFLSPLPFLPVCLSVSLFNTIQVDRRVSSIHSQLRKEGRTASTAEQ